MDLYSSKPKGWFKDKEHKTQEASELEKHKDEYTFRPAVNDPSSLKALHSD